MGSVRGCSDLGAVDELDGRGVGVRGCSDLGAVDELDGRGVGKGV